MGTYYSDAITRTAREYQKVVGTNYNLMLKARAKRKKEIVSKDFKELFKIKLGDIEFDGFEYILNSFAAVARIDYDNVLIDLFELLKKNAKDYFYRDSKELMNYLNTSQLTNYINMHVLDSLHMTQRSNFIVEFVKIIIASGGISDIISYLYDFYFINMMDSIAGNLTDCFFQFEDDTICNTEVAGYYIGLYWLLTLSPEIRLYGGLAIKKLDIVENIYLHMPEKSIHRKYIEGLVTSEDLFEICGYRLHHIMCPCVEREQLYIMLKGKKIETEEPDFVTRTLLDDWADDIYSEVARIDAIRNAIGTYLYNMNVYKELNDKNITLQVENEKYKEDKEKAENTARKTRTDYKDLQKENEKLEKELSEHEKTIHKLEECSTEKLQKTIKELRKETKESEQTEIEQTKLILEQKKELSNLRKKIKKLTSLISVEESVEPVIEEEQEEKTLDEAIECCKDKKILIVGGYGLSNFENKLKKYGIHNVTMIVESRTLNGEYDVVIALTKVIKHKMCKLVNKYCDDASVFIPYNGTNVEVLIQKMAKELEECC